jgi:hypothetical protein
VSTEPQIPGHRNVRRAWRTTVALAALTLTLAACGGGMSDEPAAPPAPPSPAPVAPTPPPVEEPPADDRPSIEVFLVRSGPADFFVEPVSVRLTEAPTNLEGWVAVALEALLSIVTPFDPDLFTSVPTDTTVRSVRIDAGTVIIDLDGGIVGSSGASAQEVTFAQQLAHTLLLAPELTEVRVLIGGTPITELWGHLDWSTPLTADPFALSPVTITTPAYGVEVAPGELVVAGRATVFEATVLVRVEREDGSVLVEDFATATEGGPGRGDWSWTVTLDAPGLYRIIAGASDPSGGMEGPPPFSVSRTVRVSG